MTCGAPGLSKAAAPAPGTSATYLAGNAGSVVVKRVDAGTLQVASATASPGWTDQVLPGGPHAKVRFTNAGNHSIVRFQATLSRNGSEMHVRVTTCQ